MREVVNDMASSEFNITLNQSYSSLSLKADYDQSAAPVLDSSTGSRHFFGKNKLWSLYWCRSTRLSQSHFRTLNVFPLIIANNINWQFRLKPYEMLVIKYEI